MSKQVVVSDWKRVFKFYSTWALAVLALVPDIYAAVVAAGLFNGDDMPEMAAWLVRGVAIAGIVGRFINQAKPEGLPPHVDTPQ